jgi:putative cardiolipin synthase
MRTRPSLGVVVVAALLVAGCASLPPLEPRSQTRALTDTDDTRLGRAMSPDARAHPGLTGVYPLSLPLDAFAARVVLADTAERTLDLQYYIWHGDQTGYLLFEAIWRAAARGVRVRLLLDDANTRGLDETIATLDAHANIEVRLYNPFVQRDARGVAFATDFARLNRRMHNKAFIADNQVAVMGGRNIGNEYYAAGEDVAFRDLDVAIAGAAVHDVSDAFDLYWNSASAYPAKAILAPAGADAAAKLEARFAATRADPAAAAYIDAVRRTPLLRQILERNFGTEWSRARVVRDDPEKTLDTTSRKDVLLLSDLLQVLGRPRTSLDLVSPYFVPGEAGTAALSRLAADGVAVRVLTNSWAATDVGPVHAGYAKRRCELARAGVRLYELKRSALLPGRPPDHDDEGEGRPTSLHAKTFAIDRERIFVGSFNFDPRSAQLNTELGIVIDSPVLARRLAAAFDNNVPPNAYEVRPAGDCVEWIERTGAGEVRHAVEPETTAAQRALIQVLGALPIEWLL